MRRPARAPGAPERGSRARSSPAAFASAAIPSVRQRRNQRSGRGTEHAGPIMSTDVGSDRSAIRSLIESRTRPRADRLELGDVMPPARAIAVVGASRMASAPITPPADPHAFSIARSPHGPSGCRGRVARGRSSVGRRPWWSIARRGERRKDQPVRPEAPIVRRSPTPVIALDHGRKETSCLARSPSRSWGSGHADFRPEGMVLMLVGSGSAVEGGSSSSSRERDLIS
jgi:hypothetical protein